MFPRATRFCGGSVATLPDHEMTGATNGRQFEGQRICIVGGTAGIGLAIARRVAGEGASVVIAGRDLGRARRVAAGVDC